MQARETCSEVSSDGDVTSCNMNVTSYCVTYVCPRSRSPFHFLFPSTTSTIKTTMGDEVFPDSVKDFVFDLHDASRRSFIASEEQALYSGTFREITAKVSEIFCVGE